MNFLETFILTCFDVVMYLILFHRIIELGYRRTVHQLICIFTVATGIAIVNIFNLDVFGTQVLCILIVFVVLRLYLLKALPKIRSYITAYTILTVILYSVQFSVVLLVQLTIGNLQYNILFGLLSQTIGVVLVYLISRYLPINLLYIYVEKKNIWAQVVLINILTLFFGVSFYWYLSIERTLDSILAISILCLITFMINVYLIRDGFVDKEQSEKLVIYETYIPMIDKLVEEVRVKQHDYNNQVQTIQSLKKYINEEGLANYVDEVNQTSIWTQLMFLDNKIIMGLLYSKYKLAEQMGIEIEFELTNYLIKSKYTDYELVELYGILIQNAIEATELSIHKKFNIEIAWKEDYNVLKVINPVFGFQADDISKMFEYKVSSKGAQRGIGLYKLKKILDRHHGQINVYYDNEHALLDIEIRHQ